MYAKRIVQAIGLFKIHENYNRIPQRKFLVHLEHLAQNQM